VTISYWEDLNAITAWKQNPEHQSAQELGKIQWYQNYSIEIARIESGYSFDRL
jgi:heme-degrading monooxygenase HmoA